MMFFSQLWILTFKEIKYGTISVASESEEALFLEGEIKETQSKDYCNCAKGKLWHNNGSVLASEQLKL